MKWCTPALLFCLVSAPAQSMEVQRSTLDFRVQTVKQCSQYAAKETSALAAILGQTFVEAGIGFASAMLEAAAADRTVTLSAVTPTSMYEKQGEELGFNAQCIRIWHGRTSDQRVAAVSVPEGLMFRDIDKPALKAWAELGLVEVPYLYAEIEVLPNESGTAVYLNPVVVFFRPDESTDSWFRSAPSLAMGIDFISVGGTVVSTALFDLTGSIQGPVLQVGAALTGKTSGWMAIPAKPGEKKEWASLVGDVNARVVVTRTQRGSAYVKALSDAFKARKGEITTAAVAQLPWNREQAQATATAAAARAREEALSAVLDAEVEVAKAEAALTAAPGNQELKAKLEKAKFEVDRRRRAASLPPKYNVTI